MDVEMTMETPHAPGDDATLAASPDPNDRPPNADAKAPWKRVRVVSTAHKKPISSVKFSADGRFVATASADSTVKVWSAMALATSDASEVTPVATLRGHDQGISDVSWSRDGAYLVSASDDRTLRVWDVEQQKCVSVLGTPTHNNSFLFSGLPLDTPGGSARSSGGVSAAAQGIIDPEGADEGHATYVFCCEFNPQGSLIASGSFDETVRLWDVRTGRCLFKDTVHQEPVSCVDFNHDGTLLATSSYDGLVRVWDVATMQCLREIILDPSVPATMARFTPNSQLLLVGALDGKLSLWDFMTPRKPQCRKSYTGHVNKKYCIAAAFTKGGEAGQSLLLSGSEDGRVVLWDVNTEAQVAAWQAAPTPSAVTLCLSVHPSHSHLATIAENELTIWERVEEEA